MSKLPEQVELDNETIKKLLSAPDRRSLKGKRDVSILRLLFETGVRISELANLKVQNLIQQENNYSIKVKTLKQRKARNKEMYRKIDSIREIPLTSKMVDLIMDYWKLQYGVAFPNNDEPFFKTISTGAYKIGPITLKAIRDLIMDAKAKSGINMRITPHTARHTFLSRIARSKDVETARILAGHESISSTQCYLHSSMKLKQEAINDLDYGI